MAWPGMGLNALNSFFIAIGKFFLQSTAGLNGSSLRWPFPLSVFLCTSEWNVLERGIRAVIPAFGGEDRAMSLSIPDVN